MLTLQDNIFVLKSLLPEEEHDQIDKIMSSNECLALYEFYKYVNYKLVTSETNTMRYRTYFSHHQSSDISMDSFTDEIKNIKLRNNVIHKLSELPPLKLVKDDKPIIVSTKETIYTSMIMSCNNLTLESELVKQKFEKTLSKYMLDQQNPKLQIRATTQDGDVSYLEYEPYKDFFLPSIMFLDMLLGIPELFDLTKHSLVMPCEIGEEVIFEYGTISRNNLGRNIYF